MSDISIIPTGACHDCGGKCVFKVHVKDGVAIRMESDTGPDEPQLRACAKGRAYRKRVYDPNRLQYPLKRVGARGEGNFERISWDEALDTVAQQLTRVKKTYGNSSILFINYTGNHTVFQGGGHVSALLTMFGGHSRVWGMASNEGSIFASRSHYGTLSTGNTRDDLVNSRLIIMWGWNPVCTIQSTGTSYYVVQAKEAGARIICVDPRFTESAALFADQWISIRPGTDAAMMAAMAYVMINENLHDRTFLNKYSLGFDEFRKYIMGEEDGIAKTPAWAEAITAVPASAIAALAREYATSRPAALIAGWGPGRTAYGEQYHRLASTLATMTGNVGIHGGGAAAFERGPLGAQISPEIEKFIDDNPHQLDVARRLRTRIHHTQVWDAILQGKAGGYPADIKLFYACSHNPLNQCPNINKGVEALKQLEFVIVHEQFMTPTAKFADILLPINTKWEVEDITRPWLAGPYFIYLNKVIDSLYESKSDLDICRELAPRLGIADFANKTDDEMLREAVKSSTDMSRDVDYDRFKQQGVFKYKVTGPQLCLKKQIEDPGNNPFPTPSGKIEISSERIARMNNPQLPAVPKYIETWESLNDPLAKKYPLQLITPHFMFRAHSCFDNIPWLKQIEAQAAWINTLDARVRGINDGDEVKVYNDRGVVIIGAKVTERIMPGTVAVPQGAWYRHDPTGADKGGNPNCLTRDIYSPGGSWPVNTALVQIERVN
ncbi:MAG: dimethyl sulfoxide reductase subunit A [Deltaproteobacteria bacterium HGW-Deltaproteobacteria-12]|nr:MAG: dimethyl sulfoxide reductase subunit A [Deltaproteobacteria bacterium HGW-Deltaproteobacteria-12]